MQKKELTTGRLLSLLGYFANALLTIYLFRLLIQKGASPEIVEIFRKIRSYFYIVYLLLLFLLGFKITLSQKIGSAGRTANQRLVEELAGPIVVNIVLTTFAYMIAKTCCEILSMVGLINWFG